jgi:5-dehydro-2-deoxygluconokinase
LERLAESFAVAARQRLVKGFAVGRTIFADAARAWLRGEIDDEAAVAAMQERFAALCRAWDEARAHTETP